MSSGRATRVETQDALKFALQTMSGQSVLFSHALAGRLGMNPSDLECLGILMATGPITAGRLAEETGLTTGAITGIVDRLERHGHVQRERDQHDRRRIFISPNHQSLQRIAPLFASMEAALEDLFARYSDEELRLILDFTNAVTAITHRETINMREQAAAAGRTEPEAAVEPRRQ